jgi:hypothetical protein
MDIIQSSGAHLPRLGSILLDLKIKIRIARAR